MTLVTLLRYYTGSRGAIVEIAATRGVLAVGFIFVLSASLARNYDGAFLPREPGVLLHGLGASVGNALVLWGLMWTIASAQSFPGIPGFWRGFAVFLGLFWMTAPMAWLYGIPYERFMPETDAIRANVWTLAFVAAARVLLITRVLSVLLSVRFVGVLLIVLLVADAEVFLATAFMDKPLVDFMGGLQHSQPDALRSRIIQDAQAWAFLLLLPCFIGACVALALLKGGRWAPDAGARRRLSPGMWALAAVSLIGWVPGLILLQPEQARRHNVEQLVHSGALDRALEDMSSRPRSDYPPVWDPPPRFAYGEMKPGRAEIAAALARVEPAPWVRAIYEDKLRRWSSFRRFSREPDTEPEAPGADPD
ncbi:MAG: hypothetical protein WD749_04625 [Phycisphaerales bacterium]